MNSHYCSTPYNLNLKLKELNKYNNLRKNGNINLLYKNLNDSIPAITSQFCFLKNRTNALNKSLTKIPLINNNVDIDRMNKNNFSRSYKESPNILNYSNYSYISPKPIFRPYKTNNFTQKSTEIKYHPYNLMNKYEDTNFKNNSQIELNFKYDSIMDNPIKTYSKCNNRNYSDIIKNRNNCNYKCHNSVNNNSLALQKNYYFNKYNEYNKDINDEHFKKLNNQIIEKDKIIDKMKGIIDDTFDKLNKKNQENYLLQSEIIELKSRRKFDINRDVNDNEKNNNIENNRYNNKIKEKQKIIFHKKKNYKNHKKHKRYQNYKDYNEENMEQKWEEIRKLNKKMDDLLYKNKKEF